MDGRRSSTMMTVEGVTGGTRKSHRTIPLTLFLQSFLVLSIFVVVLSNVLLLLRFVNSQSAQVSNNIASQRAASCVIALDEEVLRLVHGAAAVLTAVGANGEVMATAAPGPSLLLMSRSSRIADADMTLCQFPSPSSVMRYDKYNQSCYIISRNTSSSSSASASNGQLVCPFFGPAASLPDSPLLLLKPNQSLGCLNISALSNATLFEANSNLSTTVRVTSLASAGYGINGISVAVTRVLSLDALTGKVGGGFATVFANGVSIASTADQATFSSSSSSMLVASRVSSVNASITLQVSIDNAALESKVTYGAKLLILVSTTIGVGVAVAGALFVHLIVRGLVRMSADMRKLGALQVDDLSERRSVFSELDEIGRCLSTMARNVRLIRDALPSDVSNPAAPTAGAIAPSYSSSSAGRVVHFDDEELASMQKAIGVHTVRVHVSFESRASSKTISSAVFDFSFGEDDMGLFDRLSTECKINCNQDEFDPVTIMFVSRRNEHELLRNSVHLLEILSTRPADIRLVMYRAVSARYGVVLTSFFDVINVFSTVAFVARLAVNNTDTTSLSTFCALYACALCLNAGLTVWLLRSSNNDEFAAWARKSHAEVAWCVFFSTLNMQNIELVWTGMRVRLGDRCLLRFNAPAVESLLQRSISWSMFGFLFSDVAQLMYKVWQVYGSGSHVEFTYVFALATSGLSVAFNLMFKFHAILLWSSQRTDGSDSGPNEETGGDLVMKEVSLMLVQGSVASHVVQLNLRSVEWNEFYSEVLAMCRRARAMPLTISDGKVLIGFNVHRRCPDHQREAIQAALRLADGLAKRGHASTIALASGTYNVGVLGSLHHKCLHVIGPTASLNQMCAAALLTGQRIVIAAAMAEALGIEPSAYATAPPGTVIPSDFVFASSRVHVMCPRLLFSGFFPLPTPLHELEPFFIAFLDSEEAPPVDFRLRQFAALMGLKSLERDQLQDVVQRVLKYIAKPEEVAAAALETTDEIVLSPRRVLYHVLGPE